MLANSMLKADGSGKTAFSRAMMVTAGAAVVGGSMLYLNKKQRDMAEKTLPSTAVVDSLPEEVAEYVSEEVPKLPTGTIEEIGIETKEYVFLHKVEQFPKGKLGLSIAITDDGPLITGLEPDSALSGNLEPGDLLISVNDVDVRTMSWDEVREVLQKADMKRKRSIVVQASKTKYVRQVRR